MTDLGTVVHVVMGLNTLRYGSRSIPSSTTETCMAIVNIGRYWVNLRHDGKVQIFAAVTDLGRDFPCHQPNQCLAR